MILLNLSAIYDGIKKQNPHIWGSVSVERLERSTNGLKGRLGKKPSPIQCPAVLSPVHWTWGNRSTLDELLRCCQRFDVQWIRFTLVCECTPSSIDFITLFCFLFPLFR